MHCLSCFGCHYKFEHELAVFLHHLVGSNCNYKLWGPIEPCAQTVLEEVRPNIQPHTYKWRKNGPSPISSLRVNEYPRTAIKRRDKITLRGEVEHACEELCRVRERWSPRNFCPRYLVSLLIIQNNAWDKPYSKVNGKISNKG